MQNHIVGESQVTNVTNGGHSTIRVTNSYDEVRDINNIGHANGRCGKVLVGPRVNDPSQGNGLDKKFGILETDITQRTKNKAKNDKTGHGTE
ncbi:hypothetical protein Tco_0287951 [Tanacetum coccineum]